MMKSRRLHRDEESKDKLYRALRELYRDGVRVYTGRLPADEVLKRKVDERLYLRQTEERARPTLVEGEDSGGDPYDHSDT